VDSDQHWPLPRVPLRVLSPDSVVCARPLSRVWPLFVPHTVPFAPTWGVPRRAVYHSVVHKHRTPIFQLVTGRVDGLLAFPEARQSEGLSWCTISCWDAPGEPLYD